VYYLENSCVGIGEGARKSEKERERKGEDRDGGSGGKERVVCVYICAFQSIDWFLWWLLTLLCCDACLRWPLLFLIKRYQACSALQV
jgi:hypothetical protein